MKTTKTKTFCGAFLLMLAITADACADRQVMSDAISLLQVHDAALSYSQDGRDGVITTIGSIKNTSNNVVDELVVEVKYFDQNNALIDTVTQTLYGTVIPPGQDVSFRVRDSADKQKTAYASSIARVVSAEQRVVVEQSRNSKSVMRDLFVSWGPMLLLIAVWIVFMRKVTKKGSPQRISVELLEKQTETLSRQLEVLERLANAAEKLANNQGHSLGSE